MGHENQIRFLSRRVNKDAFRKVVEIGSKDYGSTVPWRHAFSSAEYIGVDLEAGPGVDVVADVTKGVDGLPDDADLVICCSVLEHVARPWVAAPNLESLLRPGGLMYVAVPWVWRFHPYPDDYYRYSASGIRELFPGIDWRSHAYSTNVVGDFYSAGEGADNALAKLDGSTKFLPYLELHSLGVKRGG